MTILSLQNANFGLYFGLVCQDRLSEKFGYATQGSITWDVLDYVGKLESRTCMFIL